MTLPHYSASITVTESKAYATAMKCLFCCLLLVLASAFAQGDTFAARHIWDVVNADWNEDGRFDKALLAINPDDSSQVDLYLYLSSEKGLLLATYVPAVAWHGEMFGTQPDLDVNARGSLLIYSQNDAIGRNRWRETITVAYREGQFVVAGYTYTSRDTLDLDNTMSCDVNLLTGQGVLNGEAFALEPERVSFAELEDRVYFACFSVE
jgi:hypothetical protein